MHFHSLWVPVRSLAVVSVLFLLAASPGCSNAKKYSLRGEVVAKNVMTGEITVNHGDIPGFMPAMAMLPRQRSGSGSGTSTKGQDAAEVVVGKDASDYWLEDVRITNESGRGQTKTPVAPHMLIPGERIPDFKLVNQDGKTIRLADFAGKALLVTFIYTRCPMPNFCPRLSSQFARIQDELKKHPDEYEKTHLLTVSFDPKYDTPAVLRNTASPIWTARRVAFLIGISRPATQPTSAG